MVFGGSIVSADVILGYKTDAGFTTFVSINDDNDFIVYFVYRAFNDKCIFMFICVHILVPSEFFYKWNKNAHEIE